MAQVRTFSLGGSSRLGLLLALILAVITGALVYAATNSSEDEAPLQAGGETVLVVTAARDIPAGREIAADMVTLTRVESGAVLNGAFRDAAAVVGQVARIPIYAGEQLIPAKLAAEPARDGLSYVVPAGMRAMAIQVNKVVGAGGLVRPGDRVDILAVLDLEYGDLVSGRTLTLPEAVIVAQNVEVLAVEQALENRPPASSVEGEEGTLVEQPEPNPEATVVTLALTPELMQRVFLAEEIGTIRLAVRPAGEEGDLELPNLRPIALADEEFRAFIEELLAERE